MAKYKKEQSVSPQTEEDAMKIARGIQKSGQTKDQTKLIAQGIQKGIDLYKKQQKAKLREQDKSRKKAHKERNTSSEITMATPTTSHSKQHWLPWTLLGLTWAGIIVFYFINR